MTIRKNWTNKEVAHLLKSITAAYIIKQENRFKIAAYQRAAAAISHASIEVKDLWDDNKLKEIPGVGSNIASYLDELFKTGKVKHFEAVLRPLPKAMFEFIKVPGIGPKLAYKLSLKLNIRKALGALKRLKKAAKQGKIRVIEGFGEKSEKEILQDLKEFDKQSQRLLLPYAGKIADDILAYLKNCPSVKKVDFLGSLRRMTATVGDIDIAAASQNSKKVIDWFIKYPKKARLVESGEKKARILVSGNHQVDLMVEPPSSYGSLLQHLTGSKEHNIHLRQTAQDKGLSLSEHGIKILKTKNQKLKTYIKNQKLIKFKDEKSFYNFLGMDWIPPELRENLREIKLALKHKLPKLVKISDIKGDLHIHSNINIEESHDPGLDSMEKMIEKAKKLNYQYLAFSEHNPSLAGHTNKQIITLLKRKKHKIDKLNYSRENNMKNNRKKLFIFNSLEIDIKPNGKRAISDGALKYLDFAIAAVHSSFRLEREKMTKRILAGLNHPKVKILAHPTGRILNKREGYELDWDKVFTFCKKNNKFLEINAYPDRLDLPDVMVKKAVENGVKLVINTDSHKLDHLDLMKYGVAVARRGWAGTDDILNTLGYNKICKFLIL